VVVMGGQENRDLLNGYKVSILQEEIAQQY
jgi:hypothetical protein